MTHAVSVYGMHCERCVASVTQAVAALPAAFAVRARLPEVVDAELPGTVEYDGEVDPALLRSALEQAGFSLEPMASSAATSDSTASESDAGVALNITGMTCAACVASVERALRAVPGVQAANVSFAAESAWVEGAATVDALLSAVNAAGYRASVEATASETESPAQRLWIASAALLAGSALMLLDMTVGTPHGGPGLLLAVAVLAAMAWSGGRHYRAAWAALRRGTATMDTLIALGTLAAWLYSTLALFFSELTAASGAHATHSHAGQLYFDASLMILGFVGIGQGLELRARRSSARAVEALLALAPERALRLDGSGEQDVAVSEVRVGDWLRIRPGERIPVDVRVLDGRSHIDESMLTGEPLPVARTPGDELAAGTVNREGALVVEALRVGQTTALARIAALVRRAQTAKPSLASLADRIAGVFVPAVVAIAGLTALGWAVWGAPASFVLHTVLAVLIVACPCALGLATPMAVLVAVGRAAKLGILVRDGRALDSAARVDVLLVDKTGTLTETEPVAQVVATAAGVDADELLGWAGDLARQSTHPVARAVAALAGNVSTATRVEDVREEAGNGIVALLAGVEVRLGRADWLAANGIATPALDKDNVASTVDAARDRQWCGRFALADALRADVVDGLERLQSAGITVEIVSGDATAPVAALAARLRIARYRAQCTPADKLAAIEEHRRAGRCVGMVGDGINDGPALAAADLGIAMRQGSAIAVETADVTLLRGSLATAADAVLLARAMRANVRANLFLAFVYNVVAIPVAAGLLWPSTGWLLSPMLASAAMAASSLSVVGNALRLRGVRLARYANAS